MERKATLSYLDLVDIVDSMVKFHWLLRLQIKILKDKINVYTY